jgi:hypothetical protein
VPITGTPSLAHATFALIRMLCKLIVKIEDFLTPGLVGFHDSNLEVLLNFFVQF